MANNTGVVKWFDNAKGFGFITTSEGDDVFLHHSQVKEKGHNKDVHEGETVSFDTVENEKGISAVNVQKF